MRYEALRVAPVYSLHGRLRCYGRAPFVVNDALVVAMATVGKETEQEDEEEEDEEREEGDDDDEDEVVRVVFRFYLVKAINDIICLSDFELKYFPLCLLILSNSIIFTKQLNSLW